MVSTKGMDCNMHNNSTKELQDKCDIQPCRVTEKMNWILANTAGTFSSTCAALN